MKTQPGESPSPNHGEAPLGVLRGDGRDGVGAGPVARTTPRLAASAIRFHIGDLVLTGFPPLDGHRVADALSGELSRLLEQEGLARDWAQRREGNRSLNISLPSCPTPEAIGRAVARALLEAPPP
jgi:hypothetical protein